MYISYVCSEPGAYTQSCPTQKQDVSMNSIFNHQSFVRNSALQCLEQGWFSDFQATGKHCNVLASALVFTSTDVGNVTYMATMYLTIIKMFHGFHQWIEYKMYHTYVVILMFINLWHHVI